MVSSDVPGRCDEVRDLYRSEVADAFGLDCDFDRPGVVAVRRDRKEMHAVERLAVGVQSWCLRVEIQHGLSWTGRHELDGHCVNW